MTITITITIAIAARHHSKSPFHEAFFLSTFSHIRLLAFHDIYLSAKNSFVGPIVDFCKIYIFMADIYIYILMFACHLTIRYIAKISRQFFHILAYLFLDFTRLQNVLVLVL